MVVNLAGEWSIPFLPVAPVKIEWESVQDFSPKEVDQFLDGALWKMRRQDGSLDMLVARMMPLLWTVSSYSMKNLVVKVSDPIGHPSRR